MLKKIISFLAVAGIISFLTASTVDAQNIPAFNNLSSDQEFLRGLNLTRGQATLSDPVEASGGEVVRGIIYYHNTSLGENGAPGEAAKNVKIKVNIPTAQSTSHLITGQISADNAGTVTGTIVDGQEVGQPGLTINTLSGATGLEFIPGSVKWLPEGATASVALPFSQSGDEIISGGINLGDILGCWQFAGFVTFEVRVKALEAGQPNIVKSKTAFNETLNVNATSQAARASDVIRYTLTTKNTGTASGQAEISDDLADTLQYADVTDNGGGVITGATINFGTVNLDINQTIDKVFKVKIKNPVPAEGDFVMKNVYGNEVNAPVTPPEIGGEPIIQVDKAVRNVASNTSFQTNTSANPGNKVEFRIIIRNRHGANSVYDLRIKDQLPSGLTLVSGNGRLEIAGQTRSLPTQVFESNGYLVTDPIPSLGPIGNNDTLTLYFEATVNQGVSHNTQLTNRAFVSAKDHSEISDEASVLVQVSTQPGPTPQPLQGPGPTVKIPTTIPKTGPEAGMLAIISLASSIATGSHYLRSRKNLKDALKGVKVL